MLRPLFRSDSAERPELLLLVLAAAAAFSFATWRALLNNFAVEEGGFSGVEIGVLQSLREVPGFLAFGVVFLLPFIREQTLAYVAVALLGLGTALTGIDSRAAALYATTVLMSVGFHYYETVQTSLALQWIPKARTPIALGRMIAASSLASIVAFGGKDLIYELTRTIYENRDQVTAKHAAGKAINPRNVVRDTGTEFHPGAIRFYKEIGIWPEDE